MEVIHKSISNCPAAAYQLLKLLNVTATAAMCSLRWRNTSNICCIASWCVLLCVLPRTWPTHQARKFIDANCVRSPVQLAMLRCKLVKNVSCITSPFVEQC